MEDIFKKLRNKLGVKSERVGGLGGCVKWKGGGGWEKWLWVYKGFMVR